MMAWIFNMLKYHYLGVRCPAPAVGEPAFLNAGYPFLAMGNVIFRQMIGSNYPSWPSMPR
ncbi:MAG TPA: hypothetical protein VJ805_13505 [Nitrospiraceae bacterium]|nr:hypothetical protein [Nitrospiraceae bacterium]